MAAFQFIYGESMPLPLGYVLRSGRVSFGRRAIRGHLEVDVDEARVSHVQASTTAL